MEAKLITVSKLGTCFVPGRFVLCQARRPIRCFCAETASRAQTLTVLKHGGAVVFTGAWQSILRRYEEILAREAELLPRRMDRRERLRLSRQLRECVLTTLDCLPVDAEDITRDEMAGFLGERILPGLPVLLPAAYARQILAIPREWHAVPVIGACLVSHPDILVPRSHETIDLLCKAIAECAPDLPYCPQVLDMGCGSGVLSIAVCRLLRALQPAVTATDILPEAVATTRFNVRRLAASGVIDAERVTAACPGSLFTPVRGRRFDLVIFNAPWVNAPTRSRIEVALNDADQRTVRTFLEECPNYLSAGGKVILGYSNNAGPGAVARVEKGVAEAGLVLLRVYKDRIKTYRSVRQWQAIYAYVLQSMRRDPEQI